MATGYERVANAFRGTDGWVSRQELNERIRKGTQHTPREVGGMIAHASRRSVGILERRGKVPNIEYRLTKKGRELQAAESAPLRMAVHRVSVPTSVPVSESKPEAGKVQELKELAALVAERNERMAALQHDRETLAALEEQVRDIKAHIDDAVSALEASRFSGLDERLLERIYSL